MKLFTVGPCEMYDRTMKIGGEPVPYFRNQWFSDVYLDAETLYKSFVGAKAEDKFIALTASGTGAMEASILNCLHDDDRALVVDGGAFGHRFSLICDTLGVEHTDIVLSYGDVLDEEHLGLYDNAGYTAFIINMDETSTGQLYDMDLVSAFCRRNQLLLIVDAISAFASDYIHMGDMGINVLITSSQKGLALPPGMSFVVIDEETYASRVDGRKPKSMYFDFQDYVLNGVRGQTPFTPAVQTMVQFNDILHAIEEDGGIQAWIDRTHELAMDFRARLSELPVSIPSFPLSNAVTPVIFTNGGAKRVNEGLISRYGYVINPSGGDAADTTFRVAHIGNHTTEDNANLVKAIKEILKDTER